jgi:hypothetical protein
VLGVLVLKKCKDLQKLRELTEEKVKRFLKSKRPEVVAKRHIFLVIFSGRVKSAGSFNKLAQNADKLLNSAEYWCVVSEAETVKKETGHKPVSLEEEWESLPTIGGELLLLEYQITPASEPELTQSRAECVWWLRDAKTAGQLKYVGLYRMQTPERLKALGFKR